MTLLPFLVAPALLHTETVTLKVGDLQRIATVTYQGEADGSRPIVFAYHGHGGNRRNAERSFNLIPHWKEVIMVYPQGLPTKTKRDPEGQKNGWDAGLAKENRDFAFFDALYSHLQEKLHFDTSRCYVMGHSNGGGFTYSLLAQRTNLFAAGAPSSSPAVGSRIAKELRPVFHIAGRRDQIVDFQAQVDGLKVLAQRMGIEEGAQKKEGFVTTGVGKNGLELCAYIHPGGHNYPSDALPLIAAFFQRHHL